MEINLDDIALRLGAAAVSGILIGVNRDMANKPIGMRTLGLVSLGAAIASVATPACAGHHSASLRGCTARAGPHKREPLSMGRSRFCGASLHAAPRPGRETEIARPPGSQQPDARRGGPKRTALAFRR